MNIVLILTDQHRYDIVGANGSPICRSRNLDRLAAAGVNFNRAYSVCPLCSPARASIYTGLLPHGHGVTRNVEPGQPNAASIGGRVPTLGERLRAAGYNPLVFGKWHAGERPPSACGFGGHDVHGYGDVLKDPCYLDYLKSHDLARPEVTPVGVGYPHNLLLAGRMSGPVEASVPHFLAETAIDALRQQADANRPFFLALKRRSTSAP